MKTQVGLTLWGLDTFLDGNEERIMLARPIVKVTEREGVAVARDATWSIEPECSIKWIGIDEDGSLTSVTSDRTIFIDSPQVVAVVGPVFRQDWETIAPAMVGASQWIPIQDDYSILCLELGQYGKLAESVGEVAKNVFDKEMRALDENSESLSPLGQAALRMLIGNAAVPLDSRVVRKLAAARITRNFDAYERGLHSAVTRLGTDEKKIEMRVDDYCEIVFAKWLNRIVELSTEAKNNLVPFGSTTSCPQDPAEAGIAYRSQLVRACHFPAKKLIDGARDLGKTLGRKVVDGEWTEGHIAEMWASFAEPIPELPAESNLLYPHCIRAYVEEVKGVWQWDDGEWASRRRRYGEITKLVGSIHEQVKRPLILAFDGFPDFNQLVALMTHICASEAVQGFLPYLVNYASNELLGAPGKHPDVGVRNVFTLAEIPTASEKIVVFCHRGYSAYVRNSHLKSLLQDRGRAPESVKRAAKVILDGEAIFQVALSDRCWIAVDGGLPQPGDSEFNFLYKGLLREAHKTDSSLKPAYFANSSSFDKAFEGFVTGDSNVLMGGSVHNRLLDRWLCLPLQCTAILRSDDFQILANWQFPVPNVVDFGPRLSGRSFRKVRTQVISLFRKLWENVDEAAAVIRTQSNVFGTTVTEARQFLGALMAELIVETPKASSSDRMWSFLTHIDDMVGLIRDDNCSPTETGDRVKQRAGQEDRKQSQQDITLPSKGGAN